MVIPAIIYLILIVFGILNLILFFKLWGMCNDMRKLKDFVTGRFSLEAENAVSVRKDTKAEDTRTVTVENNVADLNEAMLGRLDYRLYNDGKVEVFNRNNGELRFTGELKTYPGYSICGAHLGEKLCIYKDVNSAVKAVIQYCIDGSVSKENLMEKR